MNRAGTLVAIFVACALGNCTTEFNRALLTKDAAPPLDGSLNPGDADVGDGSTVVGEQTSLIGPSDTFIAFIDRGRLLTRGNNDSSQLGVAPAVNAADEGVDLGDGFAKVRVGGFEMPHACAIKSEGTLWCWGRNGEGQAGGPFSEVYLAPPRQVGTERDWIDVAPGAGFTCGLRAGGLLFCWGWSGDGRLGFTGIEHTFEPTQVVTSGGWKAVSAGAGYACAIDAADAINCWGVGTSGQLGGATPTPAPAKANVAPGFARISTGTAHACAVRIDGSLYCWGDNAKGQLGTQPDAGGAPARVGTDSDWSSVSCGRYHTCGLKRDGTIFCWGDGTDGQLGLLEVKSAPVPTRVGTRTDWTEIRACDSVTCGIAGGALYCWGSNGFANIGPGGLGPFPSPRAVEFEL